MNEQQLHKMIRTRRLVLNKKRLRRHYLSSGVTGIAATFFLYLLLKGYWSGHGEEYYFPLFVGMAALALLLLANQYYALRLKEVPTGRPQEQNQLVVRATLEKLGWPVSMDREGFIEAYTPSSFPGDLRTWGAEMVSIVITDDRVLVNSICNLEHSPAQAAFSLGKNGQNVRRFRETFELLTVSRLGAGTAFIYG